MCHDLVVTSPTTALVIVPATAPVVVLLKCDRNSHRRFSDMLAMCVMSVTTTVDATLNMCCGMTHTAYVWRLIQRLGIRRILRLPTTTVLVPVATMMPDVCYEWRFGSCHES